MDSVKMSLSQWPRERHRELGRMSSWWERQEGALRAAREGERDGGKGQGEGRAGNPDVL